MSGKSAFQGSLDYRYLSRQSFSPNRGISVSIPDELCPAPSMKRSFESQKVLDRISAFCDGDNLMQRVSFLQQEFSVFGYPAIIKVESDPDQEEFDSNQIVDLVNLVNISYDLLRLWRQMLEARNDACDLQRTADAEINRLKHVTSRLKEELSGKERDLKSRDLIQHQLTRTIEDLKKKLKSEQEKSKRLTSEMSARDTQYKHEKKKRLQEIDKMQSRLHQLLQDKRQERMLGIEILNSLQRSDGRRGKWHNDQTKKSNEQDMYRLIINNYEDTHQRLLKENEGMRQYLKEMQDELISALNERTSLDQSGSSLEKSMNGEDRPSSVESSDTASVKSEASEEPMSDGMFEMPYDLVKEDIEKSIRAKWRALKREIRRSRKSRTIDTEAYKPDRHAFETIVSQQQELIDYLTSTKETARERTVPEDSYFLEEKAELEEQRKLFISQKQDFDKDRQLYSEAVRQLDHQRQNFEFEKSQWYRDSFFQLTPFRNDGRPSTSPHQKFRIRKSPQQEKHPRQKQYSRSPLSHDATIKFHQASNSGNFQSPIDLKQSLNRLHQSTGLSPENSRRFDWQWSKTTPKETKSEFAHKTSATKPILPPPSTADLYRTLGLVYHGSDKENEDGTRNIDDSSLQVCPRSSGKTSHPIMSVSSLVEDSQPHRTRQWPKSVNQTSNDDLQYFEAKNVMSHQNDDKPNFSSHARNLQLAHLKKKWNSVSELNSELRFHLCPRTTRAEFFETRPRCYSTPSRDNHADSNKFSESSPEYVSASTSVENLPENNPKEGGQDAIKESIKLHTREIDSQNDSYGDGSSTDENLDLRRSEAREKLFFDENDIANDSPKNSESHISTDKSGRKKYGLKNFMRSLLSPKWRDSSEADFTTHYSVIKDSPWPSGLSHLNFDESSNNELGNFENFQKQWEFEPYNTDSLLSNISLRPNPLFGHSSKEALDRVLSSRRNSHDHKWSYGIQLDMDDDVTNKFTSPISKSSTVLDRLLSKGTRNLRLSNSMPTLMLKELRQQTNSQNNVKISRKKVRSLSYESATMPTSTEQHKMALMSFSARLKPAVGSFVLRNGSLDISSVEEDQIFEANNDSAEPKALGNVMTNYAESQLSEGFYDKWTNINQPSPV